MAQEIPEDILYANVGQKILLEKDGKVLMCRGKIDFKEMDKRWDFPGGRLHTGEQPIEGLKRELKEELGVDFEIGRPLFACITEDTPSGVPRYYVVFKAALSNPDAEFTIAEDELSEIRWVGRDEVAGLNTWEDWRTFLQGYFEEYHAA